MVPRCTKLKLVIVSLLFILGIVMIAPDVLIFMHIAKTSGGSFNESIFKQFSHDDRFHASQGRGGALGMYYLDDIVEAYKKEYLTKRKQPRIVSGHLPFGLHAIFSGNVKYISFVRDPIDRLVSRYYYLRSIDLSNWPAKDKFMSYSLLEYVKSRMSPELYDAQTRSFCSRDYPYSINGEDYDFPMVSDLEWNEALDNIKDHFLFVAPHTKHDEVICILARLYNLPIDKICIPLFNVTNERLALHEVDKEIINIVKENNRFDTRLFNFASKLFDDYVKNLDFDLSEDVRLIKELRKQKYTEYINKS